MSDELFKVDTNWITTVVVAIWAFCLRILVGRHYTAMDRFDKRLSDIEKEQAALKAYVQGKFDE